jgi:hypothetical protein
MKKLTLNLDQLEVDTFALAESPRDARGTVHAAERWRTLPIECVTFTCGDSQIRPCLG